GVPEIPEAERVYVGQLPMGFWRVKARYGFLENPNVPAILAHCHEAGIVARPMDTTFYLGRESLIINDKSKTRLRRWRKKLYIFMSKNSRSATQFFRIPPNRVVELGAQLQF
ncbi:MAG TPA: potassium transporter Kup, partial [Gemmatimonadaceae bacterium]|nr:potassium transporter Kup [Gemmatimonadaceae bacterium]